MSLVGLAAQHSLLAFSPLMERRTPVRRASEVQRPYLLQISQARRVIQVRCACVAEGGEPCLTSGDRREPEENGTLSNIPLPPRSACRARGKRFFIYTSLLHVAEGGDAPKQNYTSIIQTINYTFITRIIYYTYHCLFGEKSCRKCDELHKKSCPKCDNSS